MGPADRLLRAARDLWRDQRRWRLTVIGAMVATIGAIFTGAIGGVATQSPPTTGTGTTTIQPTQAIPQDVAGRLHQFYQSYKDADANKANKGLWCEQVTTALGRLQAVDLAAASSAQTSAIDDAKQCLPLIADSNARIDPVSAAYKRFEALHTVGNAEAVATAAAALTEFDKSRIIAGVSGEQLTTLATSLASYKQLVASAATAAPLYRGDDPATLATATQLAELGDKIAALPFTSDDPGLSEVERRGIEASRAARSEIAASDQRIAVLTAAFPRRGDDAVGLVLALGALTPFDRARLGAKASNGIDLKEAERGSREAIGTALVKSAESYAKTATFDGAKQLDDLESLAHDLGVTVPTQAKPTVAQAKNDLAGSRIRIAALREAAAGWQQVKARGQRDAGLEARVAQVLAAIVPAAGVEPNTFDAAAMTAQDQSALATLFAASIEIQGHVSAAQRASLSIALAAPADADANATKFFANVTTQLKEIGYTISPTPANAVVVLSLSNPGLQEGGYRADGLPQRRATVRGTMRWTYSGRIADLGTITGVGVDSDKHVLSEAALRAAAQQVARAVSSAVEGA